MKASWRQVDGAGELLAAARGWREAGLVDDATLAAITADQPPAGPRLGRVWRALVFGCVVVGIVALTATGFYAFHLREAAEVGLTLLVLGAVLAAATDVIVDRTSFRATGAEAATSLLAAGYLCAAVYLLADDALGLGELSARRLVFPWAAGVLALAAWRWGFRLCAGAAAACVLLLAAQFPGARLLWTAAAAALGSCAARLLGSRDLAPSHRRGVDLARVVALAGIYAAVNYTSFDRGWIEEIGRVYGQERHRPGQLGLVLAAGASALYPLGLLVAGWRSRDRILLDLGLLTVAFSAVTAVSALHVEPLWAVLLVTGAALAGAVPLLERWLRSGPDGERAGFTAAAFDGGGIRRSLLEEAVAVGAGQPAPPLSGAETGARGRGGAFGGGGADGSF